MSLKVKRNFIGSLKMLDNYFNKRNPVVMLGRVDAKRSYIEVDSSEKLTAVVKILKSAKIPHEVDGPYRFRGWKDKTWYIVFDRRYVNALKEVFGKKRNPVRYSIRETIYKGKAGFKVSGPDTSIFFEKKPQAEEYVRRVKAGENPENVLKDIWGISNNPAPNLYEQFHGNPGKGLKKINYEAPEPGEKLIKIGRLRRIDYECEQPSQHTGTLFYHHSGDTGDKTIDSNVILATNQRGTQLYLLKENNKSQYPYFSNRGIIG